MTTRRPRSRAAAVSGANGTSPAGVPLWNTRGRPSSGPLTSTSSWRPPAAGTVCVPGSEIGGMGCSFVNPGRGSPRWYGRAVAPDPLAVDHGAGQREPDALGDALGGAVLGVDAGGQLGHAGGGQPVDQGAGRLGGEAASL